MVDKIRVLLTDDGTDEIKSLAEILTANGMKLSICDRDGASVLLFIEERSPDVVIMDAFLQRFDALSVLERLNQTNPAYRPLVVVVSGVESANFERALLKSGADYCFLKPLDSHTVADRVIQLVSWRGTGDLFSHTQPVDISEKVSAVLHETGIMPNTKGYKYLKKAILLTADDPAILSSITKRLYPAVAEAFGTSAACVERSMRYAIQNTWDRGRFRETDLFFNNSKNRQKPTNAEFIATIADLVLLKKSVVHM